MAGLRIVGDSLCQWDTGRKVLIRVPANTDIVRVDFKSCAVDEMMGMKVFVEEGRLVAEIPNIMLQYSEDIKAYVVMRHSGDEERTILIENFEVEPKDKPPGYVCDQQEILRFEDHEERIKKLEENDTGGGSGDGTTDAVQYVEQELTEEEQKQARKNIGAASVDEVSKLSEEIANKGNPTDEQVKEAVNAYLEKNPIEGGTVPVSNSIKMAVTHPIGKLFETEYLYNSWVHNNVKYDSVNDKIVVLWSASSGHTNTDRRIMMAKINPRTFEAEIVKTIYDNGGLGADVSTYGFEILDNGTYITFISVYGSEVENYGMVVAYKSTDYGDSWTFVEASANNLKSNASYEFFGLTKLSNGRLLMIEYNTKNFMYSDNDGMTWECSETSSRLHEPCFIECSNGNIICIGRKTMYGTSNGAWSGTKQIEPAVYWISSDYGTTWEYKGDSTTITEMTASNCCSVIKDGYIDLFVCSRYPHGDKFGVVYHYYASEENALKDNWGTPKVVLYPNCAIGQDFSYIGCCTDSLDNIHVFYYDGIVEGETDIYYLIANKNPVNIPVNADATNVLAIPYSSKMTQELINKAVAKLTGKINELYVLIGEIPEGSEELDGTMYITDSLYEMFDFTAENQYSESNVAYTGIIQNMIAPVSTANWGLSKPTDTTFNSEGCAYTLMPNFNVNNNLSNVLTYENGVTIEWLLYNGDISNTQANLITVNASLNNLVDFRVNYFGRLDFSYTKSDGSATTVYLKGSENIFKKEGYHHLVITMDNESFCFYDNGVLFSSLKFATELSDFASLKNTGVDWFHFGIYSNNENSYTKNLRIYQKVLSAEEVKNNYQYEIGRVSED